MDIFGNRTKRPDCNDCSKTEGGFIWIGLPVCYECMKKRQAKEMLKFIKENSTKEEREEFLK